MRILAIETTAVVASVALYEDGTVRCVQRADSARKHAETVLPMVHDVLQACDLHVDQVDFFAVDIGPGSFTGVRIGVTVANALAYAARKPVISINALETLAEPFFDQGRPVLAMVDARNENAYAAAYCGLETYMEPCAEKVEDIVNKMPDGAIVVGDVKDVRWNIAEDNRFPDAAWLARAAAKRTSRAHESAVPMYLRPSQAERMRKEAGKR